MPNPKRAPLLAAALLAASACDPGPGVVVGDAYLVPDLEHEVSLAGLRVRLIPEMEKVQELDSALARFCPTRGQRDMRSATPEALARAWTARSAFLDSIARRSVVADGQARFRIEEIPAGRYRLWADTLVGKTRWTWLQKVWVRGGDTLRVNLSNANPDENPFRCDL